jgi:hypothetical protein
LITHRRDADNGILVTNAARYTPNPTYGRELHLLLLSIVIVIFFISNISHRYRFIFWHLGALVVFSSEKSGEQQLHQLGLAPERM